MSESNILASILYPIKYEDPILKEKAKECGMLVENDGRREVVCKEESLIRSLEQELNRLQMPFDVVYYAWMHSTPQVKKVRPAERYHKEIPCLLYTDESDYEGFIPVSRLGEILSRSSDGKLRANLLKEIQAATFACSVL